MTLPGLINRPGHPRSENPPTFLEPTAKAPRATERDMRRAEIAADIERAMQERCPIRPVKRA